MKKKKKKVQFSGLIYLFLLIFSILFLVLLFRLNILPFLYYAIVCFIVLFLLFIMLFLLPNKNKIIKYFGYTLMILDLVFLIIGSFVSFEVRRFMDKISILDKETINYCTYNYNGYNEDNKVYYIESPDILEIKEKNNDKYDWQKVKTMEELLQTKKTIMVSDLVHLTDNWLVKDCYPITIERKREKKSIDITKESFHILISGSDTYKGIETKARSDVNMIATINPVTHHILLTSVPRDYYVRIYGTEGYKDKLTHAGLKGIDTTRKTMEELLHISISYYTKFNFTALVSFVDVLGGIDVDNPSSFTADYQEEEHIYYEFKEGYNHLDGSSALAYVRERYSLKEGDIARAKHQHQVIKGIMDKLDFFTIVTKYDKLIDAIFGNFATDFSSTEISTFIKYELLTHKPWTIETQVLNGTSSSEKTYSMPDVYSSVIIPNEDELNKAIEKILQVVNEN